MRHLIIKLSFLFVLIVFWFTPSTNAHYSDIETSSGNIISAGCWNTTSPIIYNISHLVATPEGSNDTKATISWNTNKETDSNLYWTTDNIIWNTFSDLNFSTDHSLEIFGLFTDTTYYYYVISSDSTGNLITSSINNFSTSGMVPENFTPTTDIVINEFLPNPIGEDSASKPGGEWVELYNRGVVSIDLTGWYLINSDPSHVLDITTLNTASSDPSTNDLLMAPGEFMVVYQNKDFDFLLDDNIDQVNLYDNASIPNLIDQYSYDVNLGDIIFENKSIARYPDGSDTWFDPIPSPLGSNILESWQLNRPEINYTFDGQKLSFNIKNVEKFKQLEYQLTYNSDLGKQGVVGINQLNNQSSYEKGKIIFGTCSTGGTCVYHSNLNDILLKIILTNDSGAINLEKIIN